MKNLMTIVLLGLVALHSHATLLDQEASLELIHKQMEHSQDPQVKLFKERIQLFGLDKVNQKARRGRNRSRRSSFDFPGLEALKDELNIDLRTSFLDQAQEELGECPSENCLVKKEGYNVFIDENESEHCYPGTVCEYYQCMEKKYQCKGEEVGYFSDLAYPTCSSYVRNIQAEKFTDKGVDWIYRVMVCLQKGLFEECDMKGNCSLTENRGKVCDHIVDFTLKFHPGCYLESGVGVCKLPLKDQLAIWKTVGPYLTTRERREAYKVVWSCLF